jgi:hypothetical protein
VGCHIAARGEYYSRVEGRRKRSSTGEDEWPRGREVRAIRDATSPHRGEGLSLVEPAGRPSRMRDRSGPAIELDGAGPARG